MQALGQWCQLRELLLQQLIDWIKARLKVEARIRLGDAAGRQLATASGEWLERIEHQGQVRGNAERLPKPVLPVRQAEEVGLDEPGHPFANGRGFVAYPGVDTATEMVSLMTAMRAYEANVSALNAARTLALRALDIGSGT